jgi:hypothetical protein
MNIRTVQKKDIIYKNGHSPLFLRFTENRKSKFISLEVSVLPEHWDNEQQMITTSCPKFAELQALITTKRNEYIRKIQKLEILEIPVTLNNLFEQKNKRINCTFTERFEREIGRLESLGKHGSASKHRTALSLLKQANMASRRLEDIDLSLLNDFEFFLRKRGNKDNSILVLIKSFTEH